MNKFERKNQFCNSTQSFRIEIHNRIETVFFNQSERSIFTRHNNGNNGMLKTAVSIRIFDPIFSYKLKKNTEVSISDIKTYNASSNITKLRNNIQQTLDEIEKFCLKRHAKLNPPKTKELIIAHRKKINNILRDEKPLTLQNMEILTVLIAKFLGIIFDNNLNFKQHVKEIAAKAQPRVYKIKGFCKPEYGPNIDTAIRLFKTFARSLFDYGNTATIAIEDSVLAKWEAVQNNFLYSILKIPHISQENLLDMANLPSIKDRITYLTSRWYNSVIAKQNQPVIDFINNDARIGYKNEPKHRPTPLQLIQERLNSQGY